MYVCMYVCTSKKIVTVFNDLISLLCIVCSTKVLLEDTLFYTLQPVYKDSICHSQLF